MKFQHLKMGKVVNGITVVAALTCSLVMTVSFVPSVSAETQEVELYQDPAGEWKIKELNAKQATQPGAQPQMQTASNDLAAEIEGATDVELYQDSSGEWKVRYVKSGAKTEEAPKTQVSKEPAAKPAVSKEPVLASQAAPKVQPKTETKKQDNTIAVAKTTKEIDVKPAEKSVVSTAAKPVAKPAAAAVVQPVAKKPAPVVIAKVEPVAQPIVPKVEAPKETIAIVEEPPTAKGSDLGQYSPIDTAYSEPDQRDENNLWELGAEVFAYKYKQDLFENNLGFMQGKTNEGNLYGVHVGYEHIFAQNPPNRSFKDILQNFDNVNRYKVTADYSFGPAEYTDRGDFGDFVPGDDFVQQMLEVRGVGGYDFMITDKTRVTPFIGLGYRFVHDPSGGFLDIPLSQIRDGNTGQTFSPLFFDPLTGEADIIRSYSSQLHSFYLPVGLMTESEVTDDISLGLNMEFDYVFLGVQRSSLSDLGSLYLEDVPTDPRTKSLKDFSNKLKGGIGLKGSVRMTKKQNKFDWYIEPYVRYWHLRKNEKQYELVTNPGGQTSILYYDAAHTRPYKRIEPDNTTTEYGVQVGLVF